MTTDSTASAAFAQLWKQYAADSARERFYIDSEFDGHGGPLLSFGIVGQDGDALHIMVSDAPPVRDPWVAENVLPLMDCGADYEFAYLAKVPLNRVGIELREFIGDCQPTIIADSPVDIGRFCQALSTGEDGQWASAEYPMMRFEVHNVDCYPSDVPGAVQHNALWDALALRNKLTRSGEREPAPSSERDGVRVTEADFERAAAEVHRLQRELDITNADHIALWLDANMPDASVAFLACRIVEAHEAEMDRRGKVLSEIIDGLTAELERQRALTTPQEPALDLHTRNEALEEAAKVCSDKARQWRNFASMGLPAMPDPIVCKVFAEKADELATAIRALAQKGEAK